MKEDWINELRRKLEDYQVDPPPGLWDDICKQMGLSPEPVRKPAATKRWYWAVAAGVLALIGFFAVYHYDNPDSSEPQLQTEALVVSQPTEQTKSSELFSEPQAEAPLLALTSRPNQGGKLHNPRLTSGLETCPPDSEPDSAEIQQKMPEEPQQTENGALEHRSLGSSEHSHSSVPNGTLSSERTLHSRPDKWSVGLNASGGLLAAANVRTDRLYCTPASYSAEDNKFLPVIGTTFGNSYTKTEIVSKHHLPVRFGLSVQYQLSPRLALLSGFNYTRLSSEFGIPLYQNISYNQRLHYLGIPFGVAWQLWSVNHFRFYLSGGAMVEKCVSADVEVGSTSKKPWQWSVNAAAGAEYTFIPQLGVYLEPSLGYYFDDGTSLEHYYKEHPLAPSIEFGLRLHLAK